MTNHLNTFKDFCLNIVYDLSIMCIPLNRLDIFHSFTRIHRLHKYHLHSPLDIARNTSDMLHAFPIWNKERM